MNALFSQFELCFQQLAQNHEKGQGLIEYALIVLLIALSVLLVLGLVGGQVQTAFQVIVDALAGVAGS